VTLARKSDTGLYSCEVINTEGIDMASSQVIVRGKKDNNKNSIIGEITYLVIHLILDIRYQESNLQ
jgi:hypothetical protein